MEIKDYIINNFKDDKIDTLKNAIDESVLENDEEVLPGLGVFMTLLWQNSNDELKDTMLNIIYNKIKNN